MAEVTKRQTLIECLEIMRKIRDDFSHKGRGMAPAERYVVLFEEYDRKCEILRELIQGLECEQVRKALADWQKDVMDNGPTALLIREEELKLNLNIRDPELYEMNHIDEGWKHGREAEA